MTTSGWPPGHFISPLSRGDLGVCKPDSEITHPALRRLRAPLSRGVKEKYGERNVNDIKEPNDKHETP